MELQALLVYENQWTFQPYPVFFNSEKLGWMVPNSMASLTQPFLSFNILMFVGLVTGLLMILIRYNKKKVTKHSSIL